MNHYHLAIDIGASGGRHILGHMEDGRMVLEEVYRFENGIVDQGGSKCWDTQRLFSEIKAGMRRCAQLGKVPVSMGVDTWGVDFVLVDKNGRRLGEAVAYRDGRTRGMEDQVYSILPQGELFDRTGVASQSYNTIYQLMALKKHDPALLERADRLLMSPDYYHFLLTGVQATEYTIATTGQLVNRRTGDWDRELIGRLGYPQRLFVPICQPGAVLGGLTKEVQREVGFDCRVVLPCSHDTASAVLALPTNEKTVYISSGTWSLMGVELAQANCSEESRAAGFTNEGGYQHQYRFLKNIMGLWMIQSVRREYQNQYSFAQLCAMAEEERAFPSRVDVNDDAFFAPESMITAIRGACERTGQRAPETPGQLSAMIYQSLAACYGQTIRQIEALTGERFDTVSVVGGGSNAEYLNQLTANATGRTVYAGPAEATAIGNLAVQMIACGALESRAAARDCIFRSFHVKTYHPEGRE